MKQLLVFTALTAVLTGCGFPADRAVRAYDACIARHSQDVVTAALNLGTQLMQIKPLAW